MNEEHVDEKILEVAAYFTLSGQRHDITESLIDWCRRFFIRRSNPVHFNQMDWGDPFVRFERLMKDFDDVLGRVSNMVGTINYVFIDECSAFVTWYLYHRTWGQFVEERPTGVSGSPTSRAGTTFYANVPTDLNVCRLLLRDLGLFLQRVRRGGGVSGSAELDQENPG